MSKKKINYLISFTIIYKINFVVKLYINDNILPPTNYDSEQEQAGGGRSNVKKENIQ